MKIKNPGDVVIGYVEEEEEQRKLLKPVYSQFWESLMS